MALDNPSFSICIHAAPASVHAQPHNAGAVTMEFEKNAALTIFCQSAEMAIDLEAAIDAVIRNHAARAADERAAA